MSENRFADCEAVRSVLWRFHDEVSKPNCRGITDEALARIRELTPPIPPPTVSEEARQRARDVAVIVYQEPDWIAPRLVDDIARALGYSTDPQPAPAVSEEARERAREVIMRTLNVAVVRNPVQFSADLLNRIIDALGYQPAEPKPVAVSEEARERAQEVLDKGVRTLPISGRNVYLRGLLVRIIDALGYTPPNPCDELTAETERLGLYDRPPVPQPVVDLAPDELRWLAAVVEDYEKLCNDASRVVDIDTLPPSLELRLVDAGLPAKVVCGENCWVLRIGGTDE